MTWGAFNRLLLVLPILASSCNPEIIENPEEINLNLEACVPDLTDKTLDIATWDLKSFPISSNTLNYIDDMIEDLNADIIAIQGVKSPFALSELIYLLPDWEAILHPDGDLHMGFLYKPSEVTITHPESELTNDSHFRQPPLSTRVTHTSTELEVVVINLSMQCCDGSVNRDIRREGMAKLKDWVDRVYGEDNLLLLGNFNERLDFNSEDSPLRAFVTDSENYSFADASIAMGDIKNWSDLSNKEHFDHILISNELFDKVVDVRTVAFSDCLPNYQELVSDHHPVYISFQF